MIGWEETAQEKQACRNELPGSSGVDKEQEAFVQPTKRQRSEQQHVL